MIKREKQDICALDEKVEVDERCEKGLRVVTIILLVKAMIDKV